MWEFGFPPAVAGNTLDAHVRSEAPVTEPGAVKERLMPLSMPVSTRVSTRVSSRVPSPVPSPVMGRAPRTDAGRTSANSGGLAEQVGASADRASAGRASAGRASPGDHAPRRARGDHKATRKRITGSRPGDDARGVRRTADEPEHTPAVVKATKSLSAGTIPVRRTLASATPPPSRESDARLWNDYITTRSIDARNRLVTRYADLARLIADRERSRLPAEVDPDDLRQAAVIALMDAIVRFDPAMGNKFETFCSLRLRGGILDELRKLDWVPRLVRVRTGKIDRVRQTFEAEHGRAATREELAKLMGRTLAEFDALERDTAPPSMVSLERPCGPADTGYGLREIDLIADGRGDAPIDRAARRDLQKRIGRGFSRSERLVLTLYYYEDLTMREIGEVLELSESRVSQMHTSIVKRLRSAKRDLYEDLNVE